MVQPMMKSGAEAMAEGLILALMPNTFINSLMFILSVILIMGALTQFMNLATARKLGRNESYKLAKERWYATKKLAYYR